MFSVLSPHVEVCNDRCGRDTAPTANRGGVGVFGAQSACRGVQFTMRKAAHPPGCARCGAGAGCSAIKYQSLCNSGTRRVVLGCGGCESGPLKTVHLSRHTWPEGLGTFTQPSGILVEYLIIFHGLGEGNCCPLRLFGGYLLGKGRCWSGLSRSRLTAQRGATGSGPKFRAAWCWV